MKNVMFKIKVLWACLIWARAGFWQCVSAWAVRKAAKARLCAARATIRINRLEGSREWRGRT